MLAPHFKLIVTSLRKPAVAMLISWLLFAGNVYANSGQYIDLAPKTTDQINLILETLESAIVASDTTNLPPIVMMLHGREAHRFVRPNYQDNKSLVDQTAKLSAYGVLNVQICETWMRNNNYNSKDLFPFVNTVPFADDELERLSEEEGYTEFSIDI